MSYLLTIIISVTLTQGGSVSGLAQNNSNSQAQNERGYGGREVDRKAIVTAKPQARYTSEARAQNLEGTVRLRAVLAASGKVEDISVVTGLPYGLTESAIKAARRLKFKPAMKDGQPVSMWVTLEYVFILEGSPY